MTDTEQQLDNSDFGRPGVEKAQGWTPMPEATPAAETGSDAPLEERLVKHFDRPPEADFGIEVERAYFDADGSGKRRDENETVEPKRAAEDLTAIRAAERRVLEEQQNRELNEVLDQLHAQVGQPQPQPQAQPEAQQQPEIEQPQPEQPQWTAEQTAGVDPEVVEILNKSPKLREAITMLDYQANARAEAAEQQAAAKAQQAQAAYQHVITQNAAAALAVLTAQFPEFAGLSGSELQGALKVSNPQRAEAFRSLVGQVNTVVGAYQQQAAQQQEQQRALHAQQYERAQDTFRQYAAEQDARVLANDPPETVAAIRNGLLAEAKAAGIAEKELLAVYNSNSAMRHSFVQNLLADGMRYRLTQRSLAQAVHRPVPQVQRPGVSEPVKADPAEISAALARFNREGGNIGRDGLRNAAAIVAARRARSS